MQQRPQDAVGEAVVVALNLGRGQFDGNGVEGGETTLERLALVRVEAPRLAGPADPDALATLVVAAQPGGETPGASLDDQLAVLDMNGYRQPVRDEDHPARLLRVVQAR